MVAPGNAGVYTVFPCSKHCFGEFSDVLSRVKTKDLTFSNWIRQWWCVHVVSFLKMLLSENISCSSWVVKGGKWCCCQFACCVLSFASAHFIFLRRVVIFFGNVHPQSLWLCLDIVGVTDIILILINYPLSKQKKFLKYEIGALFLHGTLLYLINSSCSIFALRFLYKSISALHTTTVWKLYNQSQSGITWTLTKSSTQDWTSKMAKISFIGSCQNKCFPKHTYMSLSFCRPGDQPCFEAQEFDLVRGMLIAAVEERYKDAGKLLMTCANKIHAFPML